MEKDGKALARKATFTTWIFQVTLRTWHTTLRVMASPTEAKGSLHARGLLRAKEKEEKAKELDTQGPLLIALAATELGTLLINATQLHTVRA